MRTLLLLRGSAGCGKSTWIEQHGLKPYTLCADDFRMMCAAPKLSVDGSMYIDPTNDNQVWSLLFQALETRMKNGEFTVIDATNSKTSEMNRYKVLCEQHKYRIFCVDFTDIPIETVKERNRSRPELKQVPDDAIEKMYSRFETQKIPSGITVLKPDELDRIWMKKIDLSSYKKIHVIGDVHGCFTALNECMEEIGMNENEFYIFCGDYIDRGIENVEVLRFLLQIYQRKNVLLLEGNHEKWLWIWSNGGVCQSKEFEIHTRTQIEDANLDPKDIRRLYRSFGQCAWFDYNGNEWLVTHAGLSTIPENLTLISTSQMIKGVGGYNLSNDIAESFVRTTPDSCFQIHGHRNTRFDPIRVNDRVFNLEGHVEFGGALRCVTLLSDGTCETLEVTNAVYRQPEDRIQYSNNHKSGGKSVADVIIELRKNKYIQEKRYGNISSFNFTKSAFYDKVWDEQTTKARGLYINIDKQKVIARAYDKFFNINERPETKLDMLQHRMAFPATAYVKENGFLGLASWNEEDDSLFVTTKSSPDGDFAQWLLADMQKLLWDDVLSRIKEYSKEHGVTFVFECVDMENDPHVIEYPETRLYLLDIIYNDLEYHKLPFEEMCHVADELGIPRKEKAFVLETWQDFFNWYYTVMDEDYLYNGRHIEGFVVEDANGYMVKLKLAYYHFWKFMRSVAHETIRKGYIDPKRTASLTTPLANHFYCFVKKLREDTLAANDNPDLAARDVLASLPKDICTLRNMFLESEDGCQFCEQKCE